MANNFDRNKYKDSFEKRFGSGSYESGLSNAREIGKTRAQAEFEKAGYDQRVREAQKIANKQKKEQEKVQKKEAEDKVFYDLLDEAKRSKEKKKEKGFLQSVTKKTGQGANKVLDFLASLTAFDDSGYKRSQEEKKAKGVERSELDRFATRAANSANLGIPAQLQKRATGEQADYAKRREFGQGGGSDMASDFLGYLAPGVGIAKGIRGTKLGAKGIDDLLRGPLTKETAKQIAKQTGKEGAAVGAIMSGAEIGGREALNPDDYNWKQNLAQFGLETGAGAVLDPAVTLGLGKFLSKIKKPPTGNNPAEESIADTLAQMPPPPPAQTRGSRGMKESIQETLNQMPPPPKGNEPFMRGLEPPNLPETAATSTRQPNDIEALMNAYKGKESTNISQGPARTANDFSNQLDDIQSMNADIINPDGTINPTKLKEWQKANAKKQKKNSSEVTRVTDSVLDTPAKEANYTKGVNVEALKDISGFKGATNDVYRIFDDVFGKDSPVTKRVLGKLDASKQKYVNMQESLLKELDEKIVKGLGIKKGSKLSKYVQDYGEKNMSLAQLQEKSPNDWERVVEADKWFRAKYDEVIDQVNESRALVYPNNSSKQVPKRNDYYRHFTEFTGLTGLKNIFDSPGAISPHLVGTSEFTTPRTKWQGFMQKRGMGPYKSDAVGGFLNYVPGASYSTHIDPNIPNFRGLKDELADMTEDSKHMNGFVEFLHDYANDLAGKTNPVMDRFVQKYIPGGRKSMAAMSWVNTRVKKNMILGNLGSVLAQLANVPNGLAFAKQHSVKGLGRTMRTIVDASEPMHNSPFLKERYADAMYRKFNQNMLDQPEKMAGWLIETSDRMGTSFVWNASYEKGLSQGVSNPIKYADENTRRLIAGRGVGEVPLAQKSKVVQMVAPFTLEVGNLWRVMNDMKKTKDFVGLATLFASNFVLNKVMEEVRGSAVTFDPIDAMVEATNEGLSPLETAGRLGGEVLSNVPAGQFLAGLYPEYGEVGGFKGPTREEIFGSRNPQRFGTGLVAANGASDPLFKLLPSFGGNQLKKTLEGLEVMRDGGSYKEGKGPLSPIPFMGETNELKFPVEMSAEDKVKMSLFGPYASDNAREYFNDERRPLSEKQTLEYKEAEARGLGQEYYDFLMGSRRDESIKRKIKEISENKDLSKEERIKALEKVLKQMELK